jgi:transposase
VNRLHRKGGLHAGWSGGWQWSRDGEMPRLRLEIVKRSDDIKGFVVLPRRWVVERTFSWLERNRRLAKDSENLAETLATFVTLASIQLTLRRLARA